MQTSQRETELASSGLSKGARTNQVRAIAKQQAVTKLRHYNVNSACRMWGGEKSVSLMEAGISSPPVDDNTVNGARRFPQILTAEYWRNSPFVAMKVRTRSGEQVQHWEYGNAQDVAVKTKRVFTHTLNSTLWCPHCVGTRIASKYLQTEIRWSM